jgi:hypothetical protein
MVSDAEQQIIKFLEPFNNEIASLAQQLREYLRKETKPTIELVGDSTISLNIGYGFTEKAWDCYCAIIVYSKHINISFPSGTSLHDPQGLLQGTGKRIRHIKISTLKEAKDAAIKRILLDARDRALALVNDEFHQQVKIKTIIKPILGIKKRSK